MIVTTSQTLTSDFDVGMEGQVQLFFDLGRQAVPIGVVQLDVERLEPPQHGQADAAGRDGADVHAFDVVGALDAIGDVPALLDDPIDSDGM